MSDRAFVVMQVGPKDSAERQRADEIFEFLIAPTVRDAGLEPYRSDLDISPGAVTSRMLSELLQARIVIADLTGRNPNVFYELGVAHSFARPLILIAESVSSLPFDTKDERVIELGEYSHDGLTYARGERVKASLRDSLRLVLTAGYSPPSPLRDVAASRFVEQLAPEDPLAAEMTRIRETLDIIRVRLTSQPSTPRHLVADICALRQFIEQNLHHLDLDNMSVLMKLGTSPSQERWAQEIRARWAAQFSKARTAWLDLSSVKPPSQS